MHKAIWEDRITLDKKKNEIVRIVNARSIQKIIPGLKKGEQTNFDCYKQYETSPDVCRNLYRNFYNFLGVEFPKEKVWNYKHKRYVKRGYDNWDETCCNVNFNTHFLLTEREKKIICDKYPNFKYVLNKWQGTKAQTMAVLKEWKIHPEIELPLSLGYYDICFSKTFHKMNKEDLKKCFKFMNENRELNLSITDLKIVVKHGAEVAEMYSRAKTITGKRVRMNEIKWIVTQYDTYYKGISYFDFRHDLHEYYDLCKYFEKDMKDEYWAHPKNLRERTSDLRTQCENIRMLEETVKLKKKMARYTRAIKRFEGWDRTIDEYNIIIPKTVEQWEKQASVLHQCIIRMNYMDKCNDNYILVFIYKDGEPYATCEVTDVKNGKISQFYCNESDRANLYPNDKCKSIVYNWVNELKTIQEIA